MAGLITTHGEDYDCHKQLYTTIYDGVERSSHRVSRSFSLVKRASIYSPSPSTKKYYLFIEIYTYCLTYRCKVPDSIYVIKNTYTYKNSVQKMSVNYVLSSLRCCLFSTSVKKQCISNSNWISNLHLC